MPTARQLRDFEATVRAHPQWPRVLCFGDSWFNYPLAPVDLHRQLRRVFRRTAFLNESRAGRESADIKELLPGLRRLLSTYRFTALLVSMGGNDVAGGELAEYVKPADEPQSPRTPRRGAVPAAVRDHIRLGAFEQALRYVAEDFQRVIDARDALAPDCELVVHNYDYVHPSGKAFRLLGRKAGPWIKPYLDGVGLTDPVRQRLLCAWLIDQFTRTLAALVTRTPRMRLVDGRGTLREAGEWDNEIHPKGAGFRKLARSRWQPLLAGLLR